MCSRGIVQSGKYPLEEISSWGNVESGKFRSGKCRVGEVSGHRPISRPKPDKQKSTLKKISYIFQNIIPLKTSYFSE